MTRVLVTGASGFIGRHALEPLAAHGLEVHALARAEPPPELTGLAEWHRADLLSAEGAGGVLAAVRPERLLHLAWYAEPGAFWTSPENVRWVEASLRLLREFPGERAVIAGTCAEYDWRKKGDSPQFCSEGVTPLAPETLYGECKHALHRIVEAWAPASLAWGRVFFLYGPHEDPRRLVSSVARALVRGEEAPTSAGEQVRDFLHVGDVGAAFAALVASDVEGSVNVASGEGVSVRELVTMLGEVAGRPELVKVGALPSRPGEPPELVADVSRLRDEVGFSPAIALRDGLGATVEWWRGPE